MRVLVTAGPTVEPIDEVRVLTNRSSGRMGYAVASAAQATGCRVLLASGPVALPAPRGVRRIRFQTARDLERILAEEAPRADLLFMLAAVADWRPVRRRPGKAPKSSLGRLRLEPTPDLLAGVAAARARRGPAGRPFLVGFSLEARPDVRRAARKRQEKGCDLMALNTPSALGGARTRVWLLDRAGVAGTRSGTKPSVARWLVREALTRAKVRSAPAARGLAAGRHHPRRTGSFGGRVLSPSTPGGQRWRRERPARLGTGEETLRSRGSLSRRAGVSPRAPAHLPSSVAPLGPRPAPPGHLVR